MCGLNITLPLVLVGKWESQASSLPQTMGTLGPGRQEDSEGSTAGPRSLCQSVGTTQGVQP